MIFLKLFQKNKKKKITELGEMLDSPKILNTDTLIKEGEKREEALDKLMIHCMSEENLLEIIRNHSVNEKDLREVFRLLSLAGAGQWINGYYVLVASFMYPDTLKKLVEFYKNKDSTKESIIALSSDLIRIFGENRVNFS